MGPAGAKRLLVGGLGEVVLELGAHEGGSLAGLDVHELHNLPRRVVNLHVDANLEAGYVSYLWSIRPFVSVHSLVHRSIRPFIRSIVVRGHASLRYVYNTCSLYGRVGQT